MFELNCNDARYSNILESLLRKLDAKELLALDYESDYQGFVDCSVLLADNRVFSYYYSYGSCSGCDDWESRDLTEDEIEIEMEKEATFYDNIDQYHKVHGVNR